MMYLRIQKGAMLNSTEGWKHVTDGMCTKRSYTEITESLYGRHKTPILAGFTPGA